MSTSCFSLDLISHWWACCMVHFIENNFLLWICWLLLLFLITWRPCKSSDYGIADRKWWRYSMGSWYTRSKWSSRCQGSEVHQLVKLFLVVDLKTNIISHHILLNDWFIALWLCHSFERDVILDFSCVVSGSRPLVTLKCTVIVRFGPSIENMFLWAPELDKFVCLDLFTFTW